MLQIYLIVVIINFLHEYLGLYAIFFFFPNCIYKIWTNLNLTLFETCIWSFKSILEMKHVRSI